MNLNCWCPLHVPGFLLTHTHTHSTEFWTKDLLRVLIDVHIQSQESQAWQWLKPEDSFDTCIYCWNGNSSRLYINLFNLLGSNNVSTRLWKMKIYTIRIDHYLYIETYSYISVQNFTRACFKRCGNTWEFEHVFRNLGSDWILPVSFCAVTVGYVLT